MSEPPLYEFLGSSFYDLVSDRTETLTRRGEQFFAAARRLKVVAQRDTRSAGRHAAARNGLGTSLRGERRMTKPEDRPTFSPDVGFVTLNAMDEAWGPQPGDERIIQSEYLHDPSRRWRVTEGRLTRAWAEQLDYGETWERQRRKSRRVLLGLGGACIVAGVLDCVVAIALGNFLPLGSAVVFFCVARVALWRARDA